MHVVRPRPRRRLADAHADDRARAAHRGELVVEGAPRGRRHARLRVDHLEQLGHRLPAAVGGLPRAIGRAEEQARRARHRAPDPPHQLDELALVGPGRRCRRPPRWCRTPAPPAPDRGGAAAPRGAVSFHDSGVVMRAPLIPSASRLTPGRVAVQRHAEHAHLAVAQRDAPRCGAAPPARPRAGTPR